MYKQFAWAVSLSAIALTIAAPAAAQDAGEVDVQVAYARTKLVDKGDIYANDVLDPEGAYSTRETYHSILTVNYFPVDHLAIQGSISSPATTNNVPGGSLAGLPNLGDDEFTVATLGGAIYPLKGRIRPYVGGGIAFHFTTQERDGLGVNLNIPNTEGPYVNAGVKLAINHSLDVFAEARKSWYSTSATGLLPLDATYTSFASIRAEAQLDPFTVQLGLGARFGHSAEPEAPVRPRQAGDIVGKFGITNLSLADKVDLSVGGAPYAGAGLSTFEHRTVSAQFAYFITENLAVNAILGFPPTIDVYGGGSIGALPKLGEVTYGPTAVTLQYHPLSVGRVRPYAGIGASYMIVFGTKDGAFGDLEVSNDLGWAFELGVDFPVNDHIGLFAEAKKALLRPTATGTFMGNSVVGDAKLDPWAFSTGLSLTF